MTTSDLSSRVRAAIEAKARVAREAEAVASTSGTWIGPIYETLTISMGSVNPAVPAVFPGQLPFVTELPSVVLRRCEADLRTLDRHAPELIKTRSWCKHCERLWPCADFLDRAAAYGIDVEESGS